MMQRVIVNNIELYHMQGNVYRLNVQQVPVDITLKNLEDLHQLLCVVFKKHAVISEFSVESR